MVQRPEALFFGETPYPLRISQRWWWLDLDQSFRPVFEWLTTSRSREGIASWYQQSVQVIEEPGKLIEAEDVRRTKRGQRTSTLFTVGGIP